MSCDGMGWEGWDGMGWDGFVNCGLGEREVMNERSMYACLVHAW